MNQRLTQRQIQRLRELPPDYKIIAARKGCQVVRRPDGQRLLLHASGGLTTFAPPQRVQSYLHVEAG